MKSKQLLINLIASLTAFVINMGINFFLTPYITKTVGTEAYGFVSLANNFVNYATILTIALNSMAGRFITINIHKNKIEEANKYFTSILVANIFIILILTIPSIGIILYLNKILNISIAILLDVKILFTLVFINFSISIIDSTFSTSTFVRNRLDLTSKRNIEAYILKALILILLYKIFKPHVFFIGLASCFVTLYTLIANIIYTKKLLPEVKIKKEYFEFKKLIEVIKAGIWNSITKVATVFTDGLDLLICNLFISPLAMGQLSIVKTLSGVMSSLLSTLSSVFTPELTILYAKNLINEMIRRIKISMKISGLFSNIAFCFLIIFGDCFYKLWLPSENSVLLLKLTFLTIQGVIVSGAINPLYSIYTITNKVKLDSIMRVLSSILCIIVVFCLLKFTNLGIYAVAGTSTLIGLIVNFTFVPIYCAKCLKQKINIFYPTIFKYIFSTLALAIIYIILKKSIFIINSWIKLIICGIICGVLGLIINYILLFNKKEKEYLLIILKNKLSNLKKEN